MQRAQRVVRDLCEAYMNDPAALQGDWRVEKRDQETSANARHLCDFIAGMTDRFAIEEHKRLFDLDPLFR